MFRLTSLRHYLGRQAHAFPLLRKVRRLIPLRDDGIQFQSSDQYWKERYQRGGNSGEGSYGPLARYKAKFINDFCQENAVRSAIEFGCGDGNQATMFEIAAYRGIDISAECIARARKGLARPGWRFQTLDEYLADKGEQSELGLSLDVIYHLVEDEAYQAYLGSLSASATRFLLIYTSDLDYSDPKVPHVRHRPIIADMGRRHPEWVFVRSERNPFAMRHDEEREYGSFADFHLFERKG